MLALKAPAKCSQQQGHMHPARFTIMDEENSQANITPTWKPIYQNY